MRNPIVSLVRFLALWRNKSEVPHNLLPLSSVKSAVLFVDASDENRSKLLEMAEDFFKQYNISVTIFIPVKKSLNCWGFLKKRIRDKKNRCEDLFICLADIDTCFAACYEAICSPASFKVGRNKSDRDIFDLTVLVPEGAEVKQIDLFTSFIDLIKKIK